jgi:cardiolipin synthase C
MFILAVDARIGRNGGIAGRQTPWRKHMIGHWRQLQSVLLVVLLAGCASLPPPGADYPRTASVAFAHPETTRLGQQFQEAARAHPGASGFRMVQAGPDGFVTRMQMIDAAQRTLDLQYFIYRADETGLLLSDAVLRAAERGVHVRILIDDGETQDGDDQILALEAHPAVEVRVYNPFVYRGHWNGVRALEFLFNARRLDYRMHNKLMVVDNAVALVGGRNIGDAYFQINPQAQFADDDVFAAGPVVPALSKTFDEYWNSSLSIPAQALSGSQPPTRALRAHHQALAVLRQQSQADGLDQLVAHAASSEPFAGPGATRLKLEWAPAQVIVDSPDKRTVEAGTLVGRLMQREVTQATSGVQRELLMVTPYLIPGEEGMQLFRELRQREVNVRILTGSLESSTVSLAHAGYMHYRVPLLESGVELYEIRALLGNSRGSGQSAKISRYGNYALHAKLFVFDRKRLFVGSMNFDQRSMHLNTELGLLIDSPALAQQVAARFEAMVQPTNAYQVRLRSSEAGTAPGLLWQTQEGGKTVVYEIEPARSDWQRLKVNVLTLLPIDDEL